MELLVEARQLSAVAPSGILFTAVNAHVCLGDVAVISGAPGIARTALLLALCGRFPCTGGMLLTANGQHADAAQLRRRTSVARAARVIRTEPTLRVCEAITEQQALAGRSRGTAQSVSETLATMGLQPPPPQVLVKDMGPVEQVLFDLALARAQGTDGICFDGVDDDLSKDDRDFVRKAVAKLAALGTACVVTSCDPGWGTIDIPLGTSVATPAEVHPTTVDEGVVDDGLTGQAAREFRPMPDVVERDPGKEAEKASGEAW
ncbi:hypothetical protein [Streptomyces sp. NPDC057910]|uniref:hypothetical protein n=1 Tax=Streptomyces sp. NPDC057910 TaxID=3346278 RepID=UPI0036EB92E3